MNRQVQAKTLYTHNKVYVVENLDRMAWTEMALFARKQDQLYKTSIGEMTYDQECIHNHLKANPDSPSWKIADMLDRKLMDVEGDLGRLAELKKAVNIFDCHLGHVWSAL